jgi:hypothetical protein
MFRYLRHMLLLSVESHRVIALRTIKLTGGGTAALDEAWRIFAEKTAAAAEVPHLVLTRSPLMLAVIYRKLVRSNLRRLSTSGEELAPESR